ncbi:unnamed protein product, partial [Nesidiocoris tenuis]
MKFKNQSNPFTTIKLKISSLKITRGAHLKWPHRLLLCDGHVHKSRNHPLLPDLESVSAVTGTTNPFAPVIARDVSQ